IRSHGVSGLTAGYSDELQAALEAGFTDYWSGDKKAEEVYNRRVAKESAYQKALEEKHPVWSNLAYMVGSILPTLASFGIPGLGLLRAGSAATTFGKLGRAALLGAGSGALHGSGAGEGLDGKLISAGIGGGIGSVAAPVGSVAGTMISYLSNKGRELWQSAPIVRGYLNPAYKDVQTKAVREVARTLYDDGVENVAKRLETAPRHAFLTDISPNLEVSLANMGKTNTHVSDILRGAHEGRLKGAIHRIGQSADENITHLQDTKVFKRILKEQGKEAHDHLYEQARQTPIGQEYYPALNKLFANKGFQKALKEAVNSLEEHILKENPQRFSDKNFSSINYKPTIELLDQVKQSLDDLIKKSERLGDNQKISGYQILKKDLVKIMDEISPIYKSARGSAAKYEGFKEAIEQGKNIAQRDVSGEGIAEG
ncbi:glycine zipper family protein, partial [Bartonella sp. 220]|nr:glycine zipper family protein [Bartonella sp. 220B]